METIENIAAKKVAVLFAEKHGVYSEIDYVDLWDIERDARNYLGVLPVVAHPPCQLWGKFAAINYKRWGGEHNKPGNDGDCFKSAIHSAVTFGGVIEHPKGSNAFKTYGIEHPVGIGWKRIRFEAWVCEVWQSAYGHKANKATWLYYVGKNPPFELNWNRPKGDYQIGFHDQRGKENNKPTLNKKEANATPILFRDELLRLALNSGYYDGNN